MNYIEYKIKGITEEVAEIIVAEMADLGFESFSEYDFQEESIDCYILETEENREQIEETLGQYGFERKVIEQQNWNQLWESEFQPISVRDRCYIRAIFHEPRQVEHQIVITPKMSFGTGHHPTTHLMVDFMLDERFDGMQGMDMGSGTGILAILAIQRGALVVDAIDIDEWAYENCIENIQMNNAEKSICAILGDASVVDKMYDFVLANINRNILLRDMPVYVDAMKNGAVLLVSGILEMDIEAISERAAELGLKREEIRLKDGWAAIKFSKI